jgi:hypothetical protein
MLRFVKADARNSNKRSRVSRRDVCLIVSSLQMSDCETPVCRASIAWDSPAIFRPLSVSRSGRRPHIAGRRRFDGGVRCANAWSRTCRIPLSPLEDTGMRVFYLTLIGLLGLLHLPALALSAEEAKPSEPLIVVRLRSVDDWIARIDNPTKGPGAAEQVGPFIKMVLMQPFGAKGLDGLDLKRPLALYGVMGGTPEEGELVAVAPITTEDAFLDLLARGKLKVEKGKDGVHTITAAQSPAPLRLRFAHKHAYVGIRMQGDFAKSKLLEPAKIMPARANAPLLSITVNLGVLPDDVRKQAMAAMEEKFREVRTNPLPGLSKEQAEMAMSMADGMVAQMISLVRDSQTWELLLDEKWGFESRLRAQSGSPLAASIAALASSPSRMAGLVKEDDLLGVLLNFRLSETARAPSFGPGSTRRSPTPPRTRRPSRSARC